MGGQTNEGSRKRDKLVMRQNLERSFEGEFGKPRLKRQTQTLSPYSLDVGIFGVKRREHSRSDDAKDCHFCSSIAIAASPETRIFKPSCSPNAGIASPTWHDRAGMPSSPNRRAATSRSACSDCCRHPEAPSASSCSLRSGVRRLRAGARRSSKPAATQRALRRDVANDVTVAESPPRWDARAQAVRSPHRPAGIGVSSNSTIRAPSSAAA